MKTNNPAVFMPAIRSRGLFDFIGRGTGTPKKGLLETKLGDILLEGHGL